MDSAASALVVNIAIAGLFAASYATIALIHPALRAAYGFSLSYAIGMLTPISELLVPHWPQPFMIVSYFAFLAGLLAMAWALARFYGAPAPWAAIAAIALGAMVLRWLIWGGTRDDLAYELAYQAPFAAASALLVRTLLRVSRRSALDLAAAGMFAVIALHFLAKPFAAATVGSGRTASDYINSHYALISQVSTGILLTAAGLLLLVIILQHALRESQAASETDMLSGLANRRGFDLRAGRILARIKASGAPASVAMFDIDHFKSINDTYGHAVGDRVIRDFAEQLRRRAPHAAVIGRIGGEEFALVFDQVDQAGAQACAETIRLAVAQAQGPFRQDGLPDYTVSGGTCALRPDDTLGQAMRRADAALYKAKQSGRNRICVAEGEP